MTEITLIEAFRVLAAQLAAFEALLLLVSAGHKIVRWSHSRGVLRQFAGVPAFLAAPVLCVVCTAEFLAAGLLVTPSDRMAGGLLACVLWTAYLTLLLRAIVSGRRDLDCGCSFGPAHRLGSFQIVRNGVLLGFAMLVVATCALSGSDKIQVSQVLAAFALLALYGALDQVMALQPLRGGEVL